MKQNPYKDVPLFPSEQKEGFIEAPKAVLHIEATEARPKNRQPTAGASLKAGHSDGGSLEEPLGVRALSSLLKKSIEGAFPAVCVQGEISSLSQPKSGHIYLCLKEEEAVLDVVCWRQTAATVGALLKEGTHIIATGTLTTYAGNSRYQLNMKTAIPTGEGALLIKLELLKKKLQAEGLFAAEKKKPLPFLPACIGVITSESGAVLHDIRHRIGDRFGMDLLLYPVSVQGVDCVNSILRAFSFFEKLYKASQEGRAGEIPLPDVLILARGGGSLEDLWGFNDERLVRAVARCPLPVISAVGHETDTTLVDYAADKRAPTPTAAAEIATPVFSDLKNFCLEAFLRLQRNRARLWEQKNTPLRHAGSRLRQSLSFLQAKAQRFDYGSQRLLIQKKLPLKAPAGRLEICSQKRLGAALKTFLQKAEGRLVLISPRPQWLRILQSQKSQSLREKTHRLRTSLQEPLRAAVEKCRGNTYRLRRFQESFLKTLREAVDHRSRLLKTLSYESLLERGFSIVRNERGALVKTTKTLRKGEGLSIFLSRGQRFSAIVSSLDSSDKKN